MKAKILNALRYIPNLTVQVNVQLDREKFLRTTEVTPTKGVIVQPTIRTRHLYEKAAAPADARDPSQSANMPQSSLAAADERARTTKNQRTVTHRPTCLARNRSRRRPPA